MATKKYANVLNLPTNVFNAVGHAISMGNASDTYMDIARKVIGNQFKDSFREAWEGQICPAIIANSPADVRRTGLAFASRFLPEVQYIRFDFLNAEDVPYHIEQNSIYLSFSVDMAQQKVELFQCGASHLSPYDKTTPEYKYLAMRSIVEIAEEAGIKRFRKRGFKSAEHLATILKEYADSVMGALKTYTGGYPYKTGVLTSSLRKTA